jgi:hypothetical protein
MHDQPTDMTPQGVEVPQAEPGHEASDVGVLGILIAGVVLASLVGVTMFAMRLILSSYEKASVQQQATRPPLFADETGQFPEPRLQRDPAVELADIREAEDESLSTYGWVDRKSGVARIPIDRAIDLLARKGLPTRSKPEQGGPESATPKGGKP